MNALVAPQITSPASWQTANLGDVVQFVGGGTPSKKQPDFWNGDIPWVSPKDMKSHIITDSIDQITPEAVSESSAKSIPAGAVLIVVRSGILSRTIPIALAGCNLTVNQDLKALIPNAVLSSRFLAYFLKSAEPQLLASVSSSATVHRLSTETLKSLQIPLLSLDEQNRIVAVLNQAFAALDRAHALAESNLNDCETLIEDIRNSIIADASTKGEVVRLSDVTSIDSKLVDPKVPATADLLHVGAGNMQSGSDQLINVKSARAEKLKSGKYLFDDQTILYSKIRPYLRKVARPDFSGLCSADVYPLSTSSTLDRNFLFHLLLSSRFTKYAIAGSDRAGMPKVNRRHLFDFEFRLPSYDRQQQAARRIDEALEKISKIRERTETKMSSLSHLRSSLLQNAFLGELG